MNGPIRSERGRLRRAIVVGAGRAGLSATLELTSRGIPVLLISDGSSFQATSARDREAFNAVDSSGPDSVERHARETARIGAGLASPQSVTRLCSEAPRLLEWLIAIGVPFSRETGGVLARAKLRGARHARGAYVEASTGRHLISALDALVRTRETAPAAEESGVVVPGEKLVRRLESWRFVRLVLDDNGAAVGVLAQDRRSLTLKAFPADGIVLCTGDYAGLFAEAASHATGAALGAVYRQGAVLSNLEFVQHHALVAVRGGASIALPELLRARGARLSGRNKDTDATASLDLTALEPSQLAPLMASLGSALLKILGGDLTREGVVVKTRALAALGGLWVDVDSSATAHDFSPRTHATSIPGLYAAGGASAEYHGAAMLAGNGAPAAVLGGQRAARGLSCFRESLAKSAHDLPKSVFDKPTSAAESDLEALFKREGKGEMRPHALLHELKLAMARFCGTKRSAEGLDELAERLNQLKEQSAQMAIQGPSAGWNDDALIAASIEDLLSLAGAVLSSAQAREESRGAHVRTDFTASSEALTKSSLVRANAEREAEPIQHFDYTCAGQNVSISL